MLNQRPNERKVREGGRKSTDWLKWSPNLSEVRKGGREFTGWLK